MKYFDTLKCTQSVCNTLQIIHIANLEPVTTFGNSLEQTLVIQTVLSNFKRIKLLKTC